MSWLKRIGGLLGNAWERANPIIDLADIVADFERTASSQTTNFPIVLRQGQAFEYEKGMVIVGSLAKFSAPPSCIDAYVRQQTSDTIEFLTTAFGHRIGETPPAEAAFRYSIPTVYVETVRDGSTIKNSSDKNLVLFKNPRIPSFLRLSKELELLQKSAGPGSINREMWTPKACIGPSGQVLVDE